MQAVSWFTNAFLLLAWSGTARAGWYLDVSCYSQAEDIKRSMASAFDLAAAGSQALEQAATPLSGSATTAQKQTQQAQIDLVGYLFAEMMSGNGVNKNSAEYINGKSVLADVQKFKEFKGIVYSDEEEFADQFIATGQGQDYKGPPPRPAGVQPLPLSRYKVKEDVFVYCNFDRFGEPNINCRGKKIAKKPGDTSVTHCNKHILEEEVELPNAKACRSQDPKAKEITQMVTCNYGGPKYDPNDPNQPLVTKKKEDVISSTIQICPIYLEDMKKAKIKSFADRGAQPAASRAKNIWKTINSKVDDALDKAFSSGAVPPIDFYKTSDVVFLHEMTHAIWGAGTRDVGKAYGWTNIRAISEDKSPKNVEKASNNADSYAYFGLAAKMISPGSGTTPERPYEDGTIKALAKAKAKREAWTTMQRLRRQAPILSKSSGSNQPPAPSIESSGSSASQSSGPPTAGQVLYSTIHQVFTTVVTKDVTQPWTTIQGSPPLPPSSSGQSKSSASVASGSSSLNGQPVPGGTLSSSSAASGLSGSSQTSGRSQTGSQPSQASDHSMPTGGSSIATVPPGPTTSSAAAAQQTTVTVTSDHSTSSVVFVAGMLPPKGTDKPVPGWKCTGPICDPKCPFPVLCADTKGDWGLINGWKPVPPPGGPPPPPGGPSPPPVDDNQPPKSEPNKSEPNKSEPKSSSKASSSSSSSCSPRVTSICDVAATVLQGSDGKATTQRTTRPCKTTTLQDCTATAGGATSVTTVSSSVPTVTPLQFVDDFNMGIPNFESLRDDALAAMVADTTDPYEYVDAQGTAPSGSTKPTNNGSSTGSSTKPTSASTSSKLTSISVVGSSTKPSASSASHASSSGSSSKGPDSKSPTSTSPTSSGAASAPAGPTHTNCGEFTSQLSQKDFKGGDSPLFKDFCKNWSAKKESSVTVNAAGGNTVTLSFTPDKDGNDKCTMSCEDAFSSLTSVCAPKDNSGNMNTLGVGDFGCGRFGFDIPQKSPMNPSPHCGNVVSKVSQTTFAIGPNRVFEGFCKDWKQDQVLSRTIYANGGDVILTYDPNDGNNKCTMDCASAFSSLSISCSQGDGKGNVYTSGAGDFACGYFAWEIDPTPPLTTFYIGTLSGDSQGSDASQEHICYYVTAKESENICTQGSTFLPINLDTSTGEGCHIKDGAGPNFCGRGFGMGYPKGYMLKEGDDCGQAQTKQLQTDPKDGVPNGTHYADIIDTDNGDQKVGECVYDFHGVGGECSTAVTSVLPEKFIKCTLN